MKLHEHIENNYIYIYIINGILLRRSEIVS